MEKQIGLERKRLTPWQKVHLGFVALGAISLGCLIYRGDSTLDAYKKADTTVDYAQSKQLKHDKDFGNKADLLLLAGALLSAIETGAYATFRGSRDGENLPTPNQPEGAALVTQSQ